MRIAPGSAPTRWCGSGSPRRLGRPMISTPRTASTGASPRTTSISCHAPPFASSAFPFRTLSRGLRGAAPGAGGHAGLDGAHAGSRGGGGVHGAPCVEPPMLLTRRNDASIRRASRDLDGKKVALERGYAAREFSKRAAPEGGDRRRHHHAGGSQAVARPVKPTPARGASVTSGYLERGSRSTYPQSEVRIEAAFPPPSFRLAVARTRPRLGKILTPPWRARRRSDHDGSAPAGFPGTAARGRSGTAVELTAAEARVDPAASRSGGGWSRTGARSDMLEKDGRHSGIAASASLCSAIASGRVQSPCPSPIGAELAERAPDARAGHGRAHRSEPRSGCLPRLSRAPSSRCLVIVTATDAPSSPACAISVARMSPSPPPAMPPEVILGERFQPVRIVTVESDAEGLAAVARGPGGGAGRSRPR